ncbi:hypothetical protein MT340_000235 [Staphylococcus sp. NRL 16/872]|uniref:hypothetical protein n=1 Tax=Staphylococcus sp. NRL 16/872 TaxID=2930131 RepID=UPI0024DE475C|nr:hypothetical protein [Staphylococcus sp. NRL 16/872]WEN69415.1 hypothetical protein MT340_000235 [Staphylococcus sp. NRL 16/872]
MIIRLISKLILKRSNNLNKYERLNRKLNGDLKYLLSVIIFILVTLGVKQIFYYYLINGTYFLLILITLGLIFVIYLCPYALIFLPNFKGKKGLVTFKIVLWCIVIALTLDYSLLLLIDRNTKIYTDEGLVTYKYGSIMWKNIGGLSYLLTTVMGLGMIIIRVVANEYSKIKNK